MSATWNYLIPSLFESRWSRRGGYAFDEEWPRIGVFCWDRAHEETMWPLGSLSLSAGVLEERGTRYWKWESTYPTGSGRLIDLAPAGEPSKEEQSLVDDAPHDRDARGALARQMAENLADVSGDPEALARSLAVYRQRLDGFDAEDAKVRGRLSIKCRAPIDGADARGRHRKCGAALSLRQDRTLVPAADEIWNEGLREVALPTLRERVRRFATV